MRALDHLEALIGHASLAGQPNGAIIDMIEAALREAGMRVHRIEEGEKAGLFAAVGPEGAGGVMLSGHVDVVPVEGQAWTRDPFRLSREGGRVYGRGTTDMKGFLACMMTAGEMAATRNLARPLKLAFSWDEELGCLGIPIMLERLDETVGAPDMVIVGEPTSMQIATGHKGKTFLEATCTGEAGHSADAPQYANALHAAADMIAAIRAEQARLIEEGARDDDYGTPHTTVHAGVMRGGVALNIVPEHAEIRFEIRNLSADDPEDIIARLRKVAGRIGRTQIAVTGGYPGLETEEDSAALRLLQELLPEARRVKVSYGTEAGHFAARGIDTLVCGPGDMAQGHKPDEFIEIAQLEACMEMMDALLARLEGSSGE